MKIKLTYKSICALILSVFFIFLIILSYYTDYRNVSSVVLKTENGSRIVIIDAGHGGADGGAVAPDGTVEKEINLQISKKLYYILKIYGFNVIMTRETDDSVHSSDAKTIRQKKVSDIHNREKIIEKNPEAVFVSIHQNKFNDSSVHGTQVFYSKNNSRSPVLAQCVQDSVVKNLQKDNSRKIKQSGTEIYLLYHSQIPSVMVECGFVSNWDDLENLKNDNYQKKIAEAIANGIINYYRTG